MIEFVLNIDAFAVEIYPRCETAGWKIENEMGMHIYFDRNVKINHQSQGCWNGGGPGGRLLYIK